MYDKCIKIIILFSLYKNIFYFYIKQILMEIKKYFYKNYKNINFLIHIWRHKPFLSGEFDYGEKVIDFSLTN